MAQLTVRIRTGTAGTLKHFASTMRHSMGGPLGRAQLAARGVAALGVSRAESIWGLRTALPTLHRERAGRGVMEEMHDLHDLTVRIKCPGCQTHLDLRAKDLAPGAFKRCWFCGIRLGLQGDDGSEVRQAVDNLARSMEELSRVLKVER